MRFVENGITATKSRSSRFMLYATLSPRFITLVSPE